MNTINPQRPPWLSVGLVSASALAYEVLLMRLFSIIQWHHFAYMIISLALLGYGVSGAFLMLAQRRLLARFADSYLVNITLFGVCAVFCFLVAQRIPLNGEEVLWDPFQSVWLLLTYLLLAVPFFFAANAIGLALVYYRSHISGVYAADLLGAGAGGIAVLALLFVAMPLQALIVIGALGIAAALLAAWELRKSLSVSLLFLPLAAALLLLPAGWDSLAISPYKGLSQALQVKDTRLIAEHASPLGLLSIVESPTIPLRHAPGLSLGAMTEPPEQLGVFTDGDGLSVINRYDGDRHTLAHLDYLTSALPYHLGRMQRVLVLGAGGGSDVLQALYHQAGHVDAVELNPQFVRLVREDFADFAGNLYNRPDVDVHVAEARSFASSSPGNYDLVQVSLLDSFSASASGQYALSENHLYTIESLAELMNALAPQGFLSMTRWVKLPPRDTLKLFSTAVEALRTTGVTEPGRQLALIRGWQTSTLLVKNGVINEREIEQLRAFCEKRAFDVAWYPGMQPEESNRFNRLRESRFHDAAVALLGEQDEQFMKDYKFSLQPASDDRPYFFHFFKWGTLDEVLALRKRGGASLADAGYLVLVATLAQAIVASVLLILLPLRISREHAVKSGPGVRPSHVLGYFFLLGLAFLFIEIAFIQKLLLFLHHPLYAIAVVLSSFLVFSGLGSAWLGRTPPSGYGRRQYQAVAGIVFIGALYLFSLDALLAMFSGWDDAARITISILLIAPLAFCMGMPFPLGLGSLSSLAPGLIPWAWGINGCASVICAVLATLIAIHLGFPVVIATALVLYALTPFLFPGRGQPTAGA